MSAIPFAMNAVGLTGTAESGAKLSTFVKGTATPQTVYTDSALTIPAANPATADALGALRVYLDSTKSYTLRIKTADSSTTLFEIEYDTGTGLFTVVFATIPNFNAFMQSIMAALAALGPDLLAAIEQVADIDAEVVIVADAMEDVETVADNITAVQDVASNLDQLALKAPIDSPVFTGTPTAPSLHVGNADTTVTRSAAGVLAVEGKNVVTNGSGSSVATSTSTVGSVPVWSDYQGGGYATINIADPLLFSSRFGRGAGPSDAVDIRITRTADYTGGTPYFTNSALIVGTTASAGGSSFEWPMLVTLDTYRTAADGAQDTALYVQAKKFSSGGAWAIATETQDNNGANPTTSTLGIEIAGNSIGTDNNNSRVLLHIIPSSQDTSLTEWGYGINMTPTTYAKIKKGINFAGLFDHFIYSDRFQIAGDGDIAYGAAGVNTDFFNLSTSGSINISGGTSNANGGSISLYGGSHGSFPNAGILRSNNVAALLWTDLGATASVPFSASTAGTPGRFTNTTDSASVQALIIEGDRATPATSDIVYASFQLSDSAGAQQEFARISVVGSNVNSGAYAGYLLFSVSNGGTRSDELRLTNTSLSPHVSGGSALGTTSLMWNGAFLASATAINWANSNYTLTHSTGLLTASGPFTANGLISATVAGNAGRFTNTTDSSSVQALIIEGDRATPANGDTVYASFNMSNASGTQVEFARIVGRASAVTAGSESGALRFATISSGSLAERMQLSGTALSPISNDQLALGSGTVSWADLFLASGGVINWNNGTYTLTQAGSVLTASGDVTVNGAFTSLGIDDNATGERIQIADTSLTYGTSGAAYSFVHAANDQNVTISGGNSTTSGANILLLGGTNGIPNVGGLYSASTRIMAWAPTSLIFDKPAQLAVYTVATLPGSPAKGWVAMVSDANATTFASIVAGGGSNNVPVYYDGTNWRIG